MQPRSKGHWVFGDSTELGFYPKRFKQSGVCHYHERLQGHFSLRVETDSMGWRPKCCVIRAWVECRDQGCRQPTAWFWKLCGACFSNSHPDDGLPFLLFLRELVSRPFEWPSPFVNIWRSGWETGMGDDGRAWEPFKRPSPSESDGGKVTVSYQQLSSVDVRNPAQLEMSIWVSHNFSHHLTKVWKPSNHPKWCLPLSIGWSKVPQIINVNMPAYDLCASWTARRGPVVLTPPHLWTKTCFFVVRVFLFGSKMPQDRLTFHTPSWHTCRCYEGNTRVLHAGTERVQAIADRIQTHTGLPGGMFSLFCWCVGFIGNSKNSWRSSNVREWLGCWDYPQQHSFAESAFRH